MSVCQPRSCLWIEGIVHALLGALVDGKALSTDPVAAGLAAVHATSTMVDGALLSLGLTTVLLQG